MLRSIVPRSAGALWGRLLHLDGHLESLASCLAKGWVWCPQRPDDTLVVSAFVGNVVLGYARADRYRHDLALSGKRDGRCAFALPLMNSWDARGATLDFFVQQLTGGRLGERHRWLRFDTPRSSMRRDEDEPAENLQDAVVLGAIDRVDTRAIEGWCIAPSGPPNEPLWVDLYVDDAWVATAKARRRNGFWPATKRTGGGRELCRFAFRTPAAFADGLDHTLAVGRADPFEPLIDGPHTVRLAASAGRSSRSVPPLAGHHRPSRASGDGARRGEYEAWIAAIEGTRSAPPAGDPSVSLLLERSLRQDVSRHYAASAFAVSDGSRLVASRYRAGSARSLRHAIAGAPSEWLALASPGARPSVGWREAFRTALADAPDAAVFTFDDDLLGPDGTRRLPRFKPQYCPDRTLTDRHFEGLTLVRTPEARDAFRTTPVPYDGATLALKVARTVGAGRVRHVPRIGAHRARESTRRRQRDDGFVAALLRREGGGIAIERRGIAGRPQRRVVWPRPATPPLTTLIIPTKDRANLFEPLAWAILREKTLPLEMILVDNASSEPDTFAAFSRLAADPRVRLTRYPDPFNFSAANNLAARQAEGEVLVFMNNDVAEPCERLLDEMMRQALRPDVGVVGARLAYANGSNQHCGIALGIGGVASNLLRGHTGLGDADHGRFAHVQSVSAVSAALMAVRADVFGAVGGFEEALPLAYNDVDFCLRVTRDTGLRVIYTPHAFAYHLESQSRGRDDTPSKRARLDREKAIMAARWGDTLLCDPYLSPNHALTSRDLRPATTPREVSPTPQPLQLAAE